MEEAWKPTHKQRMIGLPIIVVGSLFGWYLIATGGDRINQQTYGCDKKELTMVIDILMPKDRAFAQAGLDDLVKEYKCDRFQVGDQVDVVETDGSYSRISTFRKDRNPLKYWVRSATVSKK
jgi:hypothetical protein